ncbi:hypothetical protein SDC9_148750 [bioreactor metagenome]|uniref:Uncharacterized protein n=1 Tax=bioreactor metagenome TaxID=1076179 RepID=A0A645EHX8_9ZZZZ
MFFAECVQLRGRHVEQRRHLIDESARAAGAGAVHAFLKAAREKDDFRVLAAQFHDHVGIGVKTLDRSGGGKDLLDKFQTRGFGDAETGRSGDRYPNLAAAQPGSKLFQHFRRFFPHLGHVALICFKYHLIVIVEQYDLDGGAAYVNSYSQQGTSYLETRVIPLRLYLQKTHHIISLYHRRLKRARTLYYP